MVMADSHRSDEPTGGDNDRPLSDRLARAEELLRRGETEAADAIVTGALAATPRDADALLLRGLIANRRRDHTAAIEALRGSLAVRPDAPRAWLALGNAHARDGQPGGRGRCLSRNRWRASPDWTRRAIQSRPDAKAARRSRRRDPRRFTRHGSRDPLLFAAARQCVATIAESVRARRSHRAPHRSSRCRDAAAISRSASSSARSTMPGTTAPSRCTAGSSPRCATKSSSIRNARSLAEAYNWALRRNVADVVVLSHDDVDILAPDFAARLFERLRTFDVVGVAGSTRMDGPAMGWSGHPHLRGWITHRAPDDRDWQVDVLDPRPVAGDIALLDGVLLAGRREAFRAVSFDAVTFDGFHLADLDWSYRAAQAGFTLGVAGDLLLVHASRGNYDATWQRYADRFCRKHDAAALAAGTVVVLRRHARRPAAGPRFSCGYLAELSS